MHARRKEIIIITSINTDYFTVYIKVLFAIRKKRKSLLPLLQTVQFISNTSYCFTKVMRNSYKLPKLHVVLMQQRITSNNLCNGTANNYKGTCFVNKRKIILYDQVYNAFIDFGVNLYYSVLTHCIKMYQYISYTNVKTISTNIFYNALEHKLSSTIL